MAPSLFRRLRQYGTTPGRHPHEDQLTEALAATLDAAPAAARTLVERFFGTKALPTDGACRVCSQPDPGEHGRADLELAFGPAGRPDLRVWFENKVDSTAYRSQGERYIGRLEELQGLQGGESRFAWVLRVGHDVDGDPPEGVPVFTWQDVASALHEWRDRQEDRESYATRLAAEFVKHLEEEGLAHTRALSERDALALNWHGEAQLPARELVEQARALVHQRWREPTRRRRRSNGGTRCGSGVITPSIGQVDRFSGRKRAHGLSGTLDATPRGVRRTSGGRSFSGPVWSSPSMRRLMKRAG